MKAFSTHILTTAFVVALALFAYDRMAVRPAQVIGVVDVGEVYRLKEAEFTQRITKTASEQDRQQALLMAHQFAQRLPVALDELPRDCRCIVVVRSALAGTPPHAIDLTALLKQKVAQP